MNSITRIDDVWSIVGVEPARIADDVCAFLDVSTTSFGRATHYNSRDKQLQAEAVVHGRLFDISRDLYQILLSLPGTTDRARQIGMSALLGSKQKNGKECLLTGTMERRVLESFVKNLPPQRMLKLFDAFRGFGNEFGAKKSNNARTRKLILRTILNSPRLELWTIKYRSKLQRILSHAWGRSLGSAIGAVAAKKRRNDKEKSMLRKHVLSYLGSNCGKVEVVNLNHVLQCIAFLYGERDRISDDMKLLQSFINAKTNISDGLKLPAEIIEGIRSTYHKNVSASELLKMRADVGGIRTRYEKRVVQKRVKEAGGKVEMNPLDYDAVELYIYAFEVGADSEILEALDKKAKDAAKLLPVSYDKLAIIVDASKSMEGSKEQPMKPLATALSIRDMLQRSATESIVLYCGGFADTKDMPDISSNIKIVKPSYETELAQSLLDALVYEPDAVYVISDGYENSPAGRFGDVLRKAREIGIDVPVIHCNPVFASETGSVRALCEGIEKVTTLPVRSPMAMGSGIIRGLIESDPRRGLNSILRIALTGDSPLAGLLTEGGVS
jgi:hypothetical protein